MKNLCILASGTGSLFSSIAEACLDKTLDSAQVVSLVTDNPKAPVLKRAQKSGITSKILNPKDYVSFSSWDQALCEYLESEQVDLILLAGFLKKIGPQTLKTFPRKVLNIHPSLLPLHGGPGMYGINVHRSVLQAGDKKTGCSIHLVSEEYDTGPVLAQAEVKVAPEDTAESLNQKVRQIEPSFYVSVLKKILQGEIHL